MNKKRVALALAAALGVNTLMVTVGQVSGQVQIAHAQNARLSTEDAKKLDGISIKYLDTVVETNNNGDVELTFKNLNKDNIKDVSGTFEHARFGERENIDGKNNSIGTVWNSNTGKLKLNGQMNYAGIYTADITVEYKDGTKETYKVSLRKTTSDTITFSTAVTAGGIKFTDVKFNDGSKVLGSVDLPAVLTLTSKSNPSKTDTVTYDATNGAMFNALKLADNGNLKEGDVYVLSYEYGNKDKNGGVYPYKLTVDVVLVGEEIKVTNSFVSNTANFSTDLENDIKSNFGSQVTVSTSPVAPTQGISNLDYSVKVDNLSLLSYSQTYNNGTVRGGAVVTPTISGSEVSLKIDSAQVANTSQNFVPDVRLSYGINTGSTATGATGLIGDYNVTFGGVKHNYFDAMSGVVNSVKVDTAGTPRSAYLELKKNGNTSPLVVPANGITGSDITSAVTPSVALDFKHGYNSFPITFTVDSESIDFNMINANITASNPTSGNAITVSGFDKVNDGPEVKTSLVIVVDKLEAVSGQLKFEKIDASQGKVTVVGGKGLIGSTDINNVNLTFGGKKASIISSESTGNDLVFLVQFGGQIPQTADWTFEAGKIRLNGSMETSQGSIDAVNLLKAGVTNSGAENIADQFRVDATFNSVVPAGSRIKVDNLVSDLVTFDQFKSGNHTLSVNTNGSGKYQGIYSAGVWVTQQPMSLKITETKSTTSGRVDITFDGTFFNTDDYKNVTKGTIQYREKVGTNETPKAWTNANVTISVGENSDISTDAQANKTVTKTVLGLTPDKEYEFQVIYDYKEGNNTIQVPSKIVTQKVSSTNSSNSTITGSGGTTTGTSTGSTTITVTTSNSTLTGTSASVTLPSGFRYDSGKTPVAVTFKYKDKDGKIVTETKEQYSNVTARFNGNNVELNGLVPGKDYNEITVDYTDNNGKTRSIILKNVKTTSQTQVETYLANVYEVVFGRPADEAGYHFHLDNLKNKKVSLRDFLLNMLNEKEFVEKYKSTEEKIEALYNSIVNRTSDEAGKKFWVDEYKKVLAVYGSETTALKAIADRMVNENELKELADKMGVQW